MFRVLFYVCFAIGFALLSGSQLIAQSNETGLIELQEAIVDLSARIESLEDNSKSEALLAELESQEAELRSLYEGLNGIGRQVALGQMFLSGQFFTIFGLLVAVAGLISGIVSAGLMRGLRAIIQKFVKKQVKSDVLGQVEASARYVTANTLGQLAFAWWNHYHHEFQKFLNGKDYDSAIVRDIRLSKDLASKGMQEFSLLDGPLASEKKSMKLAGDLRNHLVYNRTAEALIEASLGQQMTHDEREELLRSAGECMRDSKLASAEDHWYGYVETAQFCLLKFGSEREKAEARRTLLALFETDSRLFRKRKPKPTAKFLSFAFDCYFPENSETGKRVDLHGLGRIPSDPRTGP